MIINKTDFLEWQKKVIEKYYTDKKYKTALIPTINNPSCLKQSKTIMVIHFDNLVSFANKSQINKLPEKHKITLFHIGRMKNDFVSIGYKENEMAYPALDFGGLTNYKQKISKKSELLPKKFKIEKSTDITHQLDDIYNTWKRYNKKEKFYGNIKVKMNKFLRSAFKYLKSSEYTKMYISYHKLPETHRILVSSKDIKTHTGCYYERIFQGNDKFAKKSSGKNLYTAIQDGLPTINTNINKFNILNEYSTY